MVPSLFWNKQTTFAQNVPTLAYFLLLFSKSYMKSIEAVGFFLPKESRMRWCDMVTYGVNDIASVFKFV
ncbi:MAG: hypothetical protein A3I05_03210 [Deltaproteobacteria bacterium RIFCSPLOWO2_02_FULL_44_10]|nr:MAG: hypothetical protein A3C46_02785 [Deltaproteobacteria bacterium RIFCSPHIGHO2_02_FULL_44_16]OGQ46184.1 MAG: hypothetical protein A3I05_03210 [Deltaproteobacteria bacterium RIFCSPLOWO2_02_FULL_44_10]